MIDETWVCLSLTFTHTDASAEMIPGQITVTALGHVELSAEFPNQRHIEEFADGQTVLGTSASGFTVEVNGVFPERSHFDSNTNMTRIVFAPLACHLSRPDAGPVVRQEAYLKATRALGPCAFSDGTQSYELETLPNADDNRKGVVRSVLRVAGANGFDDVALLLSLAQRCLARAPLRKSYDAQGLAAVELFPNESPDDAGHPLIPLLGRELADFMNQTLAHLGTVKGPLELRRLVEYYCLSVMNQYGELKFLLASVFMEALKFYWALNVGGKPPVRKANGLIKGFEKAKNKKNDPVLFEFKELLDEACQSYGLNLNFTFVEDRNAMFHSGAPGAYQQGGGGAWAAIKPELITLYRQIDDILLTVLRYRGPIHRWDTPDQKDAFP